MPPSAPAMRLVSMASAITTPIAGEPEPEARDDARDHAEGGAVQGADQDLAQDHARRIRAGEFARGERADGDRHGLRRRIAALARDDRREHGERHHLLRASPSKRPSTDDAMKAVIRLTKSQTNRLFAVHHTVSESSSFSETPPSAFTSASASSWMTSTMSSIVITPTRRSRFVDDRNRDEIVALEQTRHLVALLRHRDPAAIRRS